ncbi:MAG TPA: PadR family transcriptional regulator [Candidatus Saccharimonadales bacterium]|nr:PadR family transcriptional regulator [Candidatus Saccharimonadales bacterium]
MKRSMNLLPQVSFSILLALSLRPRHGYEIMQQVTEDSLGKIKLGPGSLYTTIKQLTEDGLIEEVPGEEARRRYYRLTEKGRKRLNAEIEYFHNAVELARRRQVLDVGLGVI